MRRLLGGGGGSSGPVDWLIVGLGNPGERYARTPNNVGFAVAELLASRWDLPRPKQRYAGLFTEGRTGPGGPRVAILWPQTYMNEAGRSVGRARGAPHVDLGGGRGRAPRGGPPRRRRPGPRNARRDRPAVRRDPKPPRGRARRPQRPQVA